MDRSTGTAIDISPDVNIPVVTVIWSFSGMSLDDARVRFQAIQIGRDFGTTVEVTGGLTEADRLLVAPAGRDARSGLASSAAVRPSRPRMEH